MCFYSHRERISDIFYVLLLAQGEDIGHFLCPFPGQEGMSDILSRPFDPRGNV
jgi:hypothetical protein